MAWGEEMILIHCSKCKQVVGKAAKLYERLGMTVFCGKCADDLRKLDNADEIGIPDFLRGFMGGFMGGRK